MPKKRDLITRVAEAEERLDKLKLEQAILELKSRRAPRRKPVRR